MNREGTEVTRFTVERLMKHMMLLGVRRGLTHIAKAGSITCKTIKRTCTLTCQDLYSRMLGDLLVLTDGTRSAG
jgi:hypothetical protein